MDDPNDLTVFKPTKEDPTRRAQENAWLEGVEGEHAGGRFPIRAGHLLSIGRGGQAQIRLKDPNVSRLHARVGFTDGDYVLTDLGSKNGTLLNDRRVQNSKLRNWDLIQVGDTVLRFRIHRLIPTHR